MQLPATLELATSLLRDPIIKFVETGVFFMPDWVDYDAKFSELVTPIQIRKIARKCAKELKRPFLIANVEYKHTIDAKTNRYGRVEPHEFLRARLKIPKMKYTMPLVHPLMLAGAELAGRQWTFSFRDETFFNNYLTMIQTRPEMRAALRLPPL